MAHNNTSNSQQSGAIAKPNDTGTPALETADITPAVSAAIKTPAAASAVRRLSASRSSIGSAAGSDAGMSPAASGRRALISPRNKSRPSPIVVSRSIPPPAISPVAAAGAGTFGTFAVAAAASRSRQPVAVMSSPPPPQPAPIGVAATPEQVGFGAVVISSDHSPVALPAASPTAIPGLQPILPRIQRLPPPTDGSVAADSHAITIREQITAAADSGTPYSAGGTSSDTGSGGSSSSGRDRRTTNEPLSAKVLPSSSRAAPLVRVPPVAIAGLLATATTAAAVPDPLLSQAPPMLRVSSLSRSGPPSATPISILSPANASAAPVASVGPAAGAVPLSPRATGLVTIVTPRLAPATPGGVDGLVEPLSARSPTTDGPTPRLAAALAALSERRFRRGSASDYSPGLDGAPLELPAASVVAAAAATGDTLAVPTAATASISPTSQPRLSLSAAMSGAGAAAFAAAASRGELRERIKNRMRRASSVFRRCERPISVTVRGLTCAVGSNKILRDIDCSVKPGQLMAILGGSGSGKTTLLNTMAVRESNVARRGRVIYSFSHAHLLPAGAGAAADAASPSAAASDAASSTAEQYRDPESRLKRNTADTVMINALTEPEVVRKVTGYVLQNDLILPNLTVRETLMYAAQLRLPGDMSYAEKAAAVNELIVELGLNDCSEVRIGDDMHKGVSSGQKRRVSVAVQMLTDPSILFLDEPTTGLDSFSAYNLVTTLKKLSREGRTVILSIHQPRSDIFELFDSILLLSKGRLCYFGPREHMLSYFSQKPLYLTCPPTTNPADFILDMSVIDNRYAKVEKESGHRRNSLIVRRVTAGIEQKFADMARRHSRAQETITEMKRVAAAADARKSLASSKENTPREGERDTATEKQPEGTSPPQAQAPAPAASTVSASTPSAQLPLTSSIPSSPPATTDSPKSARSSRMDPALRNFQFSSLRNASPKVGPTTPLPAGEGTPNAGAPSAVSRLLSRSPRVKAVLTIQPPVQASASSVAAAAAAAAAKDSPEDSGAESSANSAGTQPARTNIGSAIWSAGTDSPASTTPTGASTTAATAASTSPEPHSPLAPLPLSSPLAQLVPLASSTTTASSSSSNSANSTPAHAQQPHTPPPAPDSVAHLAMQPLSRSSSASGSISAPPTTGPVHPTPPRHRGPSAANSIFFPVGSTAASIASGAVVTAASLAAAASSAPNTATAAASAPLKSRRGLPPLALSGLSPNASGLSPVPASGASDDPKSPISPVPVPKLALEGLIGGGTLSGIGSMSGTKQADITSAGSALLLKLHAKRPNPNAATSTSVAAPPNRARPRALSDRRSSGGDSGRRSPAITLELSGLSSAANASANSLSIDPMSGPSSGRRGSALAPTPEHAVVSDEALALPTRPPLSRPNSLPHHQPHSPSPLTPNSGDALNEPMTPNVYANEPSTPSVMAAAGGYSNRSRNFDSLTRELEGTWNDETNKHRGPLSLEHLKKQSPSFCEQTAVLTRRGLQNLFQDKLLFLVLTIECIVSALAIGWIYQSEDSLAGIKSKVALCYQFSSARPFLMNVYQTYRIAREIRIFDHERADNMYDVGPYLLADVLSQIPLNTIFPLAFTAIVYSLAGFRFDSAAPFLVMCTVQIMMQYCSTGLAFVLVSLTRSFGVSSFLTNAMFPFISLNMGFLMSSSSIPYWLRWIQPVDFAYYAFWLLSVNEFADRQYTCPFDTPVECIPFDGNVILNSLGFTDHSLVTPSIGLAVIITSFYLITFLRLRFAPEKPFDTNVSAVAPAPAAASETGSSTDSAKPSTAVSSHDTNGHASGAAKPPSGNAITTAGGVKPEAVRLTIDHLVEPPRRVTVTIERVSLSIRRESYVDQSSSNGSPQASPRLDSTSPAASFGHATDVLRNVNVHIPSGKLVAIMGASGGGKTTLLNMIATRNGHGIDPRRSNVSGRILFNGTAIDDRTWRSIVGFVRATDPLLPLLTVHETLDYSARLRLPSATTDAERAEHVQSVIHELGLKDCRDTRVGDEWTVGVSGGERRRVTIGVQMLTDPSVLLLDEPTSGLDATTSQHVTATLKRIAERGRTVICSIHQPRSEQLSMFDTLILMAKGQIVYSGPTGEPLIAYFKRLGYERQSVRGNVGDWLLDLTAVDLRNVASEAKSMKRIKHLVDNYQPVKLHPLAMQSLPLALALTVTPPPSARRPEEGDHTPRKDAEPPSPVLPPPVADWKSPLIRMQAANQAAAASAKAAVPGAAAVPGSSASAVPRADTKTVDTTAATVAADLNQPPKAGEVLVKVYHEPASFSRAFPVLLSRSWTTFSRGYGLIFARLLNFIGMAAILWSFFSLAITQDQAGAQNRIGLIQFYTNLFFIGTSNCIAAFPTERNIFYRDHADGTYSTLPFFLSYLVPEFVYELGSAFIVTSMAAFGAGLRFTVEDFFLYTVVFFCVMNAGESLGITFCSVVYEPGLSLSLMNPIVAILCMMAGLYSPSMPAPLKLINYSSVIRYSTRIVAIREFTGQTFHCTEEELAAANGVCPFTTGEELLKVYDLTESSTTGVAYDLLALITLAVLYRLIAFLLLRRAASQRR